MAPKNSDPFRDGKPAQATKRQYSTSAEQHHERPAERPLHRKAIGLTAAAAATVFATPSAFAAFAAAAAAVLLLLLLYYTVLVVR